MICPATDAAAYARPIYARSSHFHDQHPGNHLGAASGASAELIDRVRHESTRGRA